MNPILAHTGRQGAVNTHPEDGLLATLYVLQAEVSAPTSASQSEPGEQVFPVMEVYAAEHRESQWVRRYWRIPCGEGPLGPLSLPHRMRVEAPEEKTGVPGEGTTVGEYSPGLSENGVAKAPLRGTVTVRPKREVLFSAEILLTPDVLPRRRPHIFIDERYLVDEEDA